LRSEIRPHRTPPLSLTWNGSVASGVYIVKHLVSLMPKGVSSYEEFLSKAEAFLQVNDDRDVKAFVNACKAVILEKCSTFLNVEKLGAHKTFLHHR
ncbi:MAG: hypothetical protein ACYDHM_16530, partial [Acidiferrobacterales bacterium]